MAAPTGLARRPSKRSRAVRVEEPKFSTAWLRMILDMSVAVPAAATPARSSRHSRACSTTARGRSSYRRSAMNELASVLIVVPRSGMRPLLTDESLCLQPGLGHLGGLHALDVDLRVEVLHGGVVQGRGDGGEDLGDVGVGVVDRFADVDGRVVDGEEVLVVREHGQAKALDAAVGGEHFSKVAGAALG